MTNQQFGNWLQDELAKRGLKQADLARAIDMTTAGVAYLANNRRNPSPETCQKISRFLRIPESEVFRMAGLLNEKVSTTRDEVNQKLNLLPPEGQQKVLEYLDLLLLQEERAQYISPRLQEKK